MKKLLIILLFCGAAAVSYGQSGYTTINARYNWLGGIFKALGIPSGGTAAFQSGQAVRAGALYYDSTGVDSGLYVWGGLSWRNITPVSGTTYTAGSGIGISGDSIHIGGRTYAPAIFYDERSIVLTGHSLKITSGYADTTVGGNAGTYSFANKPYSPLQFGRMDSLTANDVALSIVPLSTINSIRIMKYGSGGLHNTGIFGNRFAYYHYANDSAVIRSSSTFNMAISGEQRLRIDSNYSGTRTVYRTGTSSLTRSEGPAAIGANTVIDNFDVTKHILVRGTLSGFTSKLNGSSTTNDTIENFIHFNTSVNIGAPNKVLKMYAFAPSFLYGDSIFAFFEDQTTAYNYFANGLSLGGGYTGIRQQFRNEFNSVLNDTVTINTMTAVTDTTGFDVVLRRRTDGTLVKIRADQLGVGGGSVGTLQQVLDAGSTLTSNETIATGSNTLQVSTSTAAITPFNVSSNTGAAIVAASTGTEPSISIQKTASTTNTMTTGMRLGQNPSGSSANGLGIGLQFRIKASDNGTYDAGEFGAVWSDHTAASRTVNYNFNGMNNAVSQTLMNIQPGGIVRVDNNTDTLATRADIRAATPLVGTYAQRTAITGADGYEFFQTDAQRDAPPGRYYFINTKWNYVRQAEERLVYDFNDFHSIGAANTLVGSYVYTGTGSAVPANYGVLMSTLASTTGRVVFYSGANGLFGGWVDMDLGSAYMKIQLNLTQLSTAGEEFILRVGFSDMTAGTEPNNGVYVEYDRLSSVNWRYTQAAGAGTRTETASSAAVATGSHYIEVFCPGAGGTSEFWVDGVSIGTQAATMPTVVLSPFVQFVKSAGSTPVTCQLDFTKTWHYLTTSRN